MTSRREIEEQALNTYLEHQKNQGLGNHELSKCKHFLRYLLTSLRGQEPSPEAYRLAVETTLNNFPQEPLFFNAVRDFYYYWSGVSKPDHAQRPPATPRVDARLPQPLADLLKNVEDDYWFKPELESLERQWRHLKALHDYTQELRKRGVDEISLQARVQAIKPLLYVLRDKVQDADNYRMAVDGVLLMLPRTDRWHAFVSVAREFYYFWAHLPDAATHVQVALKTADVREIYQP